MKPFHHYFIFSVIIALSGIMSPSALQSAVKDTEEEGPSLPEIWVQAGPRARLKATRAAELDADRLLVERIYGLQLDAETTVRDLAETDDAIAGAVSATLVGSFTTEPPEYMDDGRVRVIRAVKIREVVDTLNRVVKGKRLDDGSFVTESDKIKTERKTNDKMIDVMGNAALPGSEGHQKIMAKRAAELDAKRKLAARIMGENINSETTVRELALESDEIMSSLSKIIKGATPTKMTFTKNGDCEVTMEVKIKDLARTLKVKTVANTTKTQIKDEESIRTYSATGIGAMHDVLQDDSPSSDTPESSSEEVELILKEVVHSGPVIQ
jgi:hypothetical protein